MKQWLKALFFRWLKFVSCEIVPSPYVDLLEAIAQNIATNLKRSDARNQRFPQAGRREAASDWRQFLLFTFSKRKSDSEILDSETRLLSSFPLSKR